MARTRGSFGVDPGRGLRCSPQFFALYRSWPFLRPPLRLAPQSCACQFRSIVLPHPTPPHHRWRDSGLSGPFVGPAGLLHIIPSRLSGTPHPDFGSGLIVARIIIGATPRPAPQKPHERECRGRERNSSNSRRASRFELWRMTPCSSRRLSKTTR